VRKPREPYIRAATGAAAKAGRLTQSSIIPWDEAPEGVPDQARNEQPTDRGDGGHFAPGNGLAARGGRARRGNTALASSMGLVPLTSDPAFAPYKRAGDALRRAQCASLASSVGGGTCGAGPSSMIASGSLALAASRYLYDTAQGDPKTLATAAQLGKESRSCFRDAHALCALEAKARAGQIDPFAILEAEAQAFTAARKAAEEAAS
jgi:hypothetical protein